MDAVFRGIAIYFILLAFFRIAGKRSLAQITTFDFVLLLIVAETTQQALLGDDYSITNALVVIGALFFLDIVLALCKQRWPTLDKLLDGAPLLLVENGRLYKDRMDKSQVDEEDILHAARELQGLERMDQIKHAVLERSGGITIIPKRASRTE
jgi:uncharacterized membrane protein YcaP (DUF421 family)